MFRRHPQKPLIHQRRFPHASPGNDIRGWRKTRKRTYSDLEVMPFVQRRDVRRAEANVHYDDPVRSVNKNNPLKIANAMIVPPRQYITAFSFRSGIFIINT
jgi:hypothetical protein